MKREYWSFPMYKEFRYEILKNNEGKYIKILDFDDSTSSPTIPAYIDNLPVKVIGKDAFERSNIETIKLPKTLIEIEGYAFFNCKNLQKISFPDSVSLIGHQVCGLCSRLQEVKWSSSAHVIPSCAFYACFNLKNISNIDSVQIFNEYSFDKSGLEIITFPKNLIKVSQFAFGDCPNLKTIKMSNLPSIHKEAFEFSKNIQIDYCGNSRVKEWAESQGIPIIDSKLNSFLKNINEDIETIK